MKLMYLSLLIMIVLGCQSQAQRLRAERNSLCSEAITPIPRFQKDADKLDKEWIQHAKSVSRCTWAVRCSEKLAEWERDCAESRRDVLEQSAIPGSIFPRMTKCEIPRPQCEATD